MELSDSDSLSDDFEQHAKRPKKRASLVQEETAEKTPPEEEAFEPAKQRASKQKLYKCQYCPSSFTVKSNCTRHENICRANVGKAAKTFTCVNCNACYSRKDNLVAHIKICKSTKAVIRKRKPCLVKGCDAQFLHHIALIDHLRSDHQNDVSVKPAVNKKFSSISEFNAWKEKEETETSSYFSKRRGTAASLNHHFYCQHDGSGKLHSERKSSRCNLKGKVKEGHCCIAKMIARIDSETKAVNLEYFPTHSHKCQSADLLHHPLPDVMSRFIDAKLAEHIPPAVVYELTKAKFLPRNDSAAINPRANILTKKRILERGRRKRMARRRHKDDAKAVFLMVKQMLENDDSILLYKPFNKGVEHGPPEIDELPNSKELFMLGIQTQRQLELFKKHCGKVVIVDETHGTNFYKYQLLTVMVVDENRRGWPVAHLLTSKSDAATLKFFFQSINSRMGDDIRIGCVITDDDAALINSMNMGFSESLKHILCIWHVFKNFKENVKSKASKELHDSMMSEVKLIMNEKQEAVFKQLCHGFEKKYENNALEFVNYFKKHYMTRPEKWAMCYRNFPHAQVNTTGHLESFHHRLKKFYLKRRVNKRLDDLVYILLDVEWDDHCTREREATVGFSTLPQQILQRHRRGLAMEDDCVLEHSLENTWEIKSASNSSVSYVVVRHTENCRADLCFSKCSKLECHGLCAHLFSCSCPDPHPVCKHIHKLQSVLTRGQVNTGIEEPDFYILENSKNTVELCIEEELGSASNNPTGNSAHDTKWKSIILRMKESVGYLEKFITAAELKEVPEHSAIRADAVLSDLVQSLGPLDLNCQSESLLNIAEMIPAVQFTPNERLKTQVSQISSFKRPPRKRSKPDPASLAEKKKTAFDSLLTFAQNGSEGYDVDNLGSENNGDYENFTLPRSYVSDPLDVVLVCGEQEISLLDLKSLELQLPAEEEHIYLQRDPTFRVAWLHSSIIKAFLIRLCEKFKHVFFMTPDLALQASRGFSNINFLKEKEEELSTKKIIILPANITGDDWFILAVMIEEEVIRLYDPLQRPMSQQCIQCLTQLVSDLKALYPLTQLWKIKVVRFSKEEEGEDDMNCGLKICHFAEQTMEGQLWTAMRDPLDFRRHTYEVIVGNCLQRSCYFEEACGKCRKPYDQIDETEVWTCCHSCQQWFHNLCLDNPTNELVTCR